VQQALLLGRDRAEGYLAFCAETVLPKEPTRLELREEAALFQHLASDLEAEAAAAAASAAAAAAGRAALPAPPPAHPAPPPAPSEAAAAATTTTTEAAATEAAAAYLMCADGAPPKPRGSTASAECDAGAGLAEALGVPLRVPPPRLLTPELPQRYTLLLRGCAAVLYEPWSGVHEAVRRLEAKLLPRKARAGAAAASEHTCAHCGGRSGFHRVTCIASLIKHVAV